MSPVDAKPMFFGDQRLERGSARSWVIGEGHKPLAEARQIALDELAAAEADLETQDAALAEAQAELKSAIRKRDRVYEQRQEARAKVKRHQQHIAYVCSTDAPEDAAAVRAR